MRKKIICIEDIIFDKRKEVLNNSIFKSIYFRISQFKEVIFDKIKFINIYLIFSKRKHKITLNHQP